MFPAVANAAGFQVQKFDGAEAIGATGDPMRPITWDRSLEHI
ncbi:MAG: hypothetical protein ACLTY5_07945 [Angelakisella sp.]